MPNKTHKTSTRRVAGALAALTIGLAALTAGPAVDAFAMPRASVVWRRLAAKVRASTKTAARADFVLAIARASLLEGEDKADAVSDAREEFREEKSIANAAYRARLELAAALGERTPYSVEIDPADFDTPVANPYYPLVPGTVMTYEGENDEGDTETVVVTVTSDTKTILGVDCIVVRDTVTIDDELLEDTLDWYAIDNLGNVWYFGEISVNYEDGDISDVDGSWLAGVDGAYPGIVMPAVREVGDVYRQEFYLGEAEDYGEILALDASATVAYDGETTFTNCVQTLDVNTIDPDVEEHKFYAEGIGFVLETKPETGERLELISIETP